ncbi:hypothetical protein OM33_17030 [Pseudoalteromonas piratica]|uniref:Mannosyl-glycoprotein endo-beta-N-acetylglucosamidase-like domain-containing protein n=2 Tax=Pseudoalteromonas piratica TaxID=1348114 RepID=A0A0A7ELX0_9GAMM|nr:hypothetical protein OM33_17030 [Pseudoalteromonas piratica]
MLVALFVLAVSVAGYLYYFSIADYHRLPKVESAIQAPLKQLPNFSQYTDVKAKKDKFFAMLYPILANENQHVLVLRKAIIELETLTELNEQQLKWLSDVATFYKVDSTLPHEQQFSTLLRRIDIVPISLALTQAAIESGWGTSRFAQQANNLFGQWCFTKGCGVVPSARDSGKGHEVATFPTVNHAVRAYIRNLNTHPAYNQLRKERAKIRTNGEIITGIALAPALINYSEEGALYVNKVVKFIKQNKLQRFNQQFNHSPLSK